MLSLLDVVLALNNVTVLLNFTLMVLDLSKWVLVIFGVSDYLADPVLLVSGFAHKALLQRGAHADLLLEVVWSAEFRFFLQV